MWGCECAYEGGRRGGAQEPCALAGGHPGAPECKGSRSAKVKEVTVEGRRYVVCLNEEERRKDAHDRATILEALREQLRRGDKSLIGKKGYRRFLKIEGGGHFTMDYKQVAQEESYDGLFVLRTDTEHDTETVARVHKMLWMVEDTFPRQVHPGNAPHLSQKR